MPKVQDVSKIKNQKTGRSKVCDETRMIALQNHKAKLPVSTLGKTKWAKRHVEKKQIDCSFVESAQTNNCDY